MLNILNSAKPLFSQPKKPEVLQLYKNSLWYLCKKQTLKARLAICASMFRGGLLKLLCVIIVVVCGGN